MEDPINVLHIITGLDTGGAEISLYKLISRQDIRRFDSKVISLTDLGVVGRKIQELGIPVWSLDMRRGIPNPFALLHLARRINRFKPHVVQTWMYHSDLIGGLAAKLAGGVLVIWGIRHGGLNPEGNKPSTILTARVCAHLSSWLPARIICCSETSRQAHVEFGYNADKMIVIPNGFDLQEFKPDAAARKSVCQEIGVPEDALLTGLVARFDPQKDQLTFIKAVAQLKDEFPLAHFLLIGERMTWENPLLALSIEDTGMREHFHLLGLRLDVPRLTAALDIAVSSSYREGFSSAIGEAMASGVPCLVTDVGDSAMIVGDAGVVVPPRDPEALAKGWLSLIELGSDGRLMIGKAARQRIKERYSVSTMIERYEHLYREMACDLS